MSLKRYVVTALLILLVIGIFMASFTVHDFWPRLGRDFWPPDNSPIGPNLVASLLQWLVVALVATLIYPPLRRWIERELDHVHTKLDHLVKYNPNVKDLPEHKTGRPWSINKGEPK